MSDRRAFLRGASVLLGSASLGTVLQALAQTPRKATHFSESELRTLAALVDLILPATDSPAASAADTHYFIDLAIPACATPAAQKTFREGLRNLGGYSKLRPEQQVQTLNARAAKDIDLPYETSFFRILKDHTLTGYFPPEVGANKALDRKSVV